jgi:hypothetical protein
MRFLSFRNLFILRPWREEAGAGGLRRKAHFRQAEKRKSRLVLGLGVPLHCSSLFHFLRPDGEQARRLCTGTKFKP